MKKKKILLIEPAKLLSDLRNKVYVLNKFYYYPHLGLLSIRSSLEKAGHEVRYFPLNSTKNWLLELTEILRKENFDFIGISTTGYTIEQDAQVAFVASSIQPSAVIVLGGYFSWWQPLETLKYTVADVVIRGHGEIPFVELTKINLKKPIKSDVLEKIKNIPGLCVKYFDKKLDEQYIINTPFILNEDHLKNLPAPAYILEDWDRYWRAYELIRRYKRMATYTSFGCPFRCKFCSVHVFYGRKVINLPLNKVMKTIQKLSKLGSREIFIADPDFNINKKRVLDFCNLIESNKKVNKINKSIKFICQARIDLLDEEMLQAMKRSGFRYLLLGIESLSQRLLKEDIDKGGRQAEMNFKEISSKIKWIEKHGIKPFIYLILSLPTSTTKDIKETLKFANKMPKTRCEIEPFVVPFRETRYFDEYKSTDLIKYFPRTFLRYDYNGILIINKVKMPYRLLPKNENVVKMSIEILEKSDELMKKSKKLNFSNTLVRAAKKLGYI